MNFEVIAASSATLKSTGDDRAVWDLAETPPATICGALGLLKEDLVEHAFFRAHTGKWVLQLGRASGQREVGFRWYTPTRLEVLLGDVELSRWFVFFLKYMRDGLAEVDHLDVEGLCAPGRPFDFTLKVARSSPPVSGEEARRRLGSL